MKKTIMFLLAFFAGAIGFAENVDPYETGARYGWSENTGWLNANPDTGDGMQVAGDKVTGWVWGENVGWINLSCENNGTCGAVNFGVVNDGAGNLSGFAWAENVGWVNFNPVVPGDPTHYGVTIDADGYFNGWAWGENIGWIRFDETQRWSVRACIVSLEDLTNFASYWLGADTAADLYADGTVNMPDFSVFASYWRDFCPDGWQLK